MLDEEGHIDLPRMREVMKLCEGMAVTFHRAFDMCQNPMVALEQLTELGVARILTSGQQQSAELGLPLLRDLRQASHGPVIMAGAGVRLSNLHKFVDIGLHELHSSSGHLVPSTMRYRKAGVTMCSDNEFDEFSHYCVDGEMVEAMKNALALVDPGAKRISTQLTAFENRFPGRKTPLRVTELSAIAQYQAPAFCRGFLCFAKTRCPFKGGFSVELSPYLLALAMPR